MIYIGPRLRKLIATREDYRAKVDAITAGDPSNLVAEPWPHCVHVGKRVGRRAGHCEFECTHAERGGTCVVAECQACPLYDPI